MMKLLLAVPLLLLILTTLEARPKPAAVKCKTGPLDIVFVIDSSRSVRPFEFETMRRFLIDIIQNLEVGPNATRVGVIQYSSQVQNIFSLKTFFKRADMEKAINSIVPLAQGTMTGLAIQYAMNLAFTVQEGARPLHKKIPRVAVIVTDGRPQDRVTEVAAQARGAGIEIYAVGVQRADMNSLRAMASHPLEEHVFLVESFDLIQQFGKQFQDKLCGVDMCTEMDHGCQHTCVSVPGSFYCECNPGYKLNTDGKTCSPIDACADGKHGCEHQCVSSRGSYTCHCRTGYNLNQDKKTCTMINYCNFGNHSCQHKCMSIPNGYYCRCNDGFTLQADGKACQASDICNGIDHGCEFKCVSTPGSYHCVCPEGQQLHADGKTCNKCKSSHVDLVLVIDGSKSVRPQNFEVVKQFVNQIVDFLDVSAHGTRVGLVQYSSRVRTEFPLNQYKTAEDIKKAVLKVEYMEKGTMTGLALKHMLEHSFSEAEGARPLSQNIPRIGLVFTDGRSQDDIAEWARKAKESGITMFAVGVGKAVEEELREIASEPVEQHFSYSADFSTMTHIVDNLKVNICPEEGKGEIEIRSPCECEALVQFQSNTVAILENLTEKLAQMTARLEDLENQIANKK
ncbi:matrilin-4 [Terrapene carolina triunguis]|uniref:matrilin-4 n=1 Tax=Terrapene triunguis TaxID=2587831 RepID=UPI000CEFE8F3|nr:matrilin-4 [Terrapene carolina triunguis]XP_026512606.1 matrilin-4 [Terrapene carolina triunguis]XP_026512607.1 matrilin-4 [Terrapene carolina triunguis]